MDAGASLDSFSLLIMDMAYLTLFKFCFSQTFIVRRVQPPFLLLLEYLKIARQYCKYFCGSFTDEYC